MMNRTTDRKFIYITTGCFSGFTLKAYHDAFGYSKSDLDLIARSPAHWRYGEQVETPAMRLGSAVHAAVLEPETWETRYTRATGRRKPALESGPIQLSGDEWETCLRIRDAVWNHPTCQDLFSDGRAEISAFWLDRDTGLLCKCRPDWARPGLLVDLKTTTDASPAGFVRAVERYRYHVQAAYAVDGWKSASGEPADRFIFLAVEKTPPYAVGLYDLPAAVLEWGRALYRRDLATVKECVTRRQWPGYSTDIITLDLMWRP